MNRVEASKTHREDIADVVHAYSGSILRLAFTYVRSRADAEDVAQEVWLTYMRKAPAFHSEASRRAWLMQVTANRSKDHLRAARRRRTRPLSDELSYLPAEDAALIHYVMSLEEKYRIPIHLHYYEGYSIEEIAALLHAKPATVGTWLSRGRAMLKSKIGVDLDEE